MSLDEPIERPSWATEEAWQDLMLRKAAYEKLAGPTDMGPFLITMCKWGMQMVTPFLDTAAKISP